MQMRTRIESGCGDIPWAGTSRCAPWLSPAISRQESYGLESLLHIQTCSHAGDEDQRPHLHHGLAPGALPWWIHSAHLKRILNSGIRSQQTRTWPIYQVRYSFITVLPMKMCRWSFQNCFITRCLKPSNMWNYINMMEITIISRIISALPCKGR